MRATTPAAWFSIASLLGLSTAAHAQVEDTALPPAAVTPTNITSTMHVAPPRNYSGVSVMGVAGFLRLNIGSFEAYYERVLGRHHGLRIAGDFVHIHQDSESTKSHQWTFGGSLAYRYYVGEGHGGFAGLKLGYRRGYGHYIDQAVVGHVHLANEQILALAQGGYRFWIPRAHLSIVTAMGIGYARTSVWTTNRSDSVGQSAAQISQDNLATTPLAIDLELSLAYAF